MDNTIKGVDFDPVREKLIDIVEAYADFLDWDTKEEMVDSIMEFLATDNNVGHKWIPVTERLPGENEYDWVLVVVELHSRYGIYHSIPIVAELRHGEWYDSYDETIESEFEKVTHWLPLPEPPKGE